LPRKGILVIIKNEELKISVGNLLLFDGEISTRIGTLVTEKNDISFQDMKSIKRFFQKYFEFEIEKGINVDNIIMAQAARHVIVHDGARINDRFRRQVSGAKQRTLDISLDKDVIQFSQNEVELAATSMLQYFRNVRFQLEKRLEI